MILGIPKRVLLVSAFLVGVVLIYLFGADEGTSAGSEGSGPAGCRVTVTADILNVRAGPSIDATVVGQFEHHAQTAADTLVRNGYRKLAQGSWASDEFLRPVEGARCG